MCYVVGGRIRRRNSASSVYHEMSFCDSGELCRNMGRIFVGRESCAVSDFNSANGIRQFAREGLKGGVQHALEQIPITIVCVLFVRMTCPPLLVLKLYAEVSAKWRRGTAKRYGEYLLNEETLKEKFQCVSLQDLADIARVAMVNYTLLQYVEASMQMLHSILNGDIQTSCRRGMRWMCMYHLLHNVN